MGSVTYLLEVYGMERHVYKFEFKYDRQVNGKKTDFTVPVIVHDECYVDACTKVDEFVRKNFADRVTEESTIKYVGEFVHGVLKPFVEEVKEEEKMKTYVEMYEEMCGVQKNVEQLEKRVEEFEAKEKYKGGFTFVQGSRGSWKSNFDKEFGKWYCEQDVNMVKKICEAIEKQQPHILDVNSMYPQAVNVCKVYRIERDQALKENEALKKRVKYLIERNNRFEVNEKYYDEEYRKLSDEKQTHEMVINGYKKELSQLNLLMDDMEDRLEKQVVARDGMLKQLREYKVEKKRMNKTIDIIQAENESLKSRMCDSDNSEIKALQEQIKELKENHELSVQLIKRLNGDKQRLMDSIGIRDLNRFFEEGL